jgi:hypothetical protein
MIALIVQGLKFIKSGLRRKPALGWNVACHRSQKYFVGLKYYMTIYHMHNIGPVSILVAMVTAFIGFRPKWPIFHF